MIPADFHFLRPDWLYAIAPALLLAMLAWRGMGKGRNDWRHLVDAHLLRHLAVREDARRSRWPAAALALGWVLAALAMAGPTWQKVPAPALDRLDPTVVVLSLAKSMDTADRSPSRLVAARHKVQDLLARMRGGQVALVIFADMPFVAAPLTEDGRVIAQMLPELATDLMPVNADRPDLAVNKAVELLKNTGASTGRIVLVTDGLGETPAATLNAARAAAQDGFTVSVIGVGAPSATAGASTGQAPTLPELAAVGKGRFMPLAADGRDLDTILAKSQIPSPTNPLQASGLTADQWVDMGSFILIAVALLAPLAFRRGWLALIPLAAMLSGLPDSAARAQAQPQAGNAFVDPAAGVAWGDLWQTPDQKGASAFESADYGAAAKAFQNPAWQASALYKNGDYDSAAAGFARVPGGDYNRGNALARAGKLEEAVKAYDAALAAKPDDADAAFNRDLVLKALEQQKKQNQQQQQNQNQNQSQNSPQKSDDKKDDGSPQNKPDPGKSEPQTPDEQKQNQAKSDPKDDPKGEPQKQPPPPAPQGNAQKPETPPQPPPAPQKQPEPPPQPQPAQAGKPEEAPPPPAPPVAVVQQPMSEQDQNREQALRMVPDDPMGLLRARIRSHYAGQTVPAFEEQP